jgi:hypothetical protein
MTNDALKHGGYIITHPFEEFDRGTYTESIPLFLGIEECNKITVVIKIWMSPLW